MSCRHITQYKQRYGIEAYRCLHAVLVARIATNSSSIKCECKVRPCESRTERVHACLSCVYFGCFKSHIHQHYYSVTEHNLAFETTYGNVYCFDCSDYKYDEEFEKIAEEQLLSAVCQRGYMLKWKPSVKDVALLKGQQFVNVSKIGLRGITNLGKTCYMNCILQSLVHTPLFRNYFLTLQHKCEFQLSKPVEEIGEKVPSCYICEMSYIVQEFCSEKQEPIIPYRFLYIIWKTAEQLQGYKEQDAHDFLTVLLKNLHLNCEVADRHTGGDCECMIGVLFTGYENVFKKCANCNYKSSEDFVFENFALSKLALSFCTVDAALNLTLTSRLKRAMLFQEDHLTCVKCKKNKFNVKITLKKLPLILSIWGDRSCERLIQFPEFLDMTPYLFTQSTSKKKKKQTPFSKSSNVYFLCAVVEYDERGSGHYKSYVRHHKNRWFCCNDHRVKEISLNDVLKKQAYLLFYHKKVLEYEVKTGQEKK